MQIVAFNKQVGGLIYFRPKTQLWLDLLTARAYPPDDLPRWCLAAVVQPQRASLISVTLHEDTQKVFAGQIII